MAKKKRSKILVFRHDAELFFRIGLRYASKGTFDLSLKYLKKAVDAEPDNTDYQFNYGCVLAELKLIKKSNKVLINILENIDPHMSECFFGIGCNYFEMGNIKKAKEYFEKYIDFDNNGEFAEEAEDILYYLDYYEKIDADSEEQEYLLPEKRSRKDKTEKSRDEYKGNKIQGANVRHVFWNKEWEAIIDCAISKSAPKYNEGYKTELRRIWISFINRNNPQSIPVIKKREVWAAALEYIYCVSHLLRVSKAELAKKYKISASSLSSRVKAMMK